MKIVIVVVLFYINLFAWFNFSIGTNSSVINGESKEIVYSQGKTLSELIWRLPNVVLVGTDIKADISNLFFVNYSLQSNILKQSSTMDDYDWMSSTTSDWTHHSNHPNTTVDSVLMQDLSIALRSFKFGNYNIYLNYGIKNNYFSWYSKGGTYIYSNSDGSNFRGYTGSFAQNSLGITYQQIFYSKYAGLSFDYMLNNLKLTAKYGFSLSSQVSDTDIHHMRGLQFDDSFSGNTLSFIQTILHYHIRPHLSLSLNANLTNYALMVGDITMITLSKGSEVTYRNSAGISHTSYEFGLGINYKFN
jgi:outer membrane protease